MTPKDLVRAAAKLFPHAIADAAATEAWLDTYQTALGHIAPDQLREAWRITLASWSKRTPPLPVEIIANYERQNRAQAAAASAQQINGRTMKGMAEFLPGEIDRLMRNWWQDHAAWFDSALALRPGIDAGARGAFNTWLQRDANLLAQSIYWGHLPSDAPLIASERTLRYSLGNPGPKGEAARKAPPRPDSGLPADCEPSAQGGQS